MSRGGHNRQGYKDNPDPLIRKTYRIWMAMRARVAGHVRYVDVNQHPSWNEFKTFLADMGPCPSDDHSLDRFPDQDGDYKPGNCRWATSTQQNRNKSGCTFDEDSVNEIHGRYEHGESQVSIAKRFNVRRGTINNIIAGRSWPEFASR